MSWISDSRRSVPALLSQTFCPAFLSLCHYVLGKCPFVPPFCPAQRWVSLSGRTWENFSGPAFLSLCRSVPERPRGKAAEEFELETDDEGNNPLPRLQPKSPLQLQRDGLLHVVCSIYNLIFIYYQLICLEKMGTVVRLLQVEEITRHSLVCRSPVVRFWTV